MPTDQAYISVLQWPDGFTANDQTEALVAACALDPFDAAQKARRGVPQVLMRAEPGASELMMQELHRRGVLAFAPTRARMAAIGPANRIKRLIPAHDGAGYMCQMWRGDGVLVRCSDVFCMIRARLRSGTTTTTKTETDPGGFAAGYLAAGLPGAMVGSAMSARPEKNTRIRVSDVLDLYLSDGRRVRLDSDKLSFDVLGDQRGHGDHENMVKLAEMLRLRMPRAMYDEGFERFICPVQFTRERVRGVGDATIRSRDDAGPFEFYSAWAYLMYDHLLGGG